MIELVIVIVLLGILAAVALPKFVDLKMDARKAATAGIAGAISSGSTTNYAAKLAGKANAVTINQTNICTTGTLGGLLTGGWPSGYSVTADAFQPNTAADCSSGTGNEVASCLRDGIGCLRALNIEKMHPFGCSTINYFKETA